MAEDRRGQHGAVSRRKEHQMYDGWHRGTARRKPPVNWEPLTVGQVRLA
jgi:hypothetical protein